MCPIECLPNRLQHILHTPNTETCTMRRLVRVLLSTPSPAFLSLSVLADITCRWGPVGCTQAAGAGGDEEPDNHVKRRANGLAENRVCPPQAAVVQRARGDDAAEGEWPAVMEVIMRRGFLSGSYWHIIHTRWEQGGEGGGSAHY